MLASPSSGATRMQEGTSRFLQMVKIAAGVELHKQAHLPYLVYLRHPTRSGVRLLGVAGAYTAAEPDALVGLLGPRVYEHLFGQPFLAGIQTAPRTCTSTASSTAWSRWNCCGPRWIVR